MDKNVFKSKCKINDIGVTDDTLIGREGMALFVKYLNIITFASDIMSCADVFLLQHYIYHSVFLHGFLLLNIFLTSLLTNWRTGRHFKLVCVFYLPLNMSRLSSPQLNNRSMADM